MPITHYVYLKIFRILIKVSAVGIIALTLLSTEPIVQVRDTNQFIAEHYIANLGMVMPKKKFFADSN